MRSSKKWRTIAKDKWVWLILLALATTMILFVIHVWPYPFGGLVLFALLAGRITALNR